jgi:hypothetical protein
MQNLTRSSRAAALPLDSTACLILLSLLPEDEYIHTFSPVVSQPHTQMHKKKQRELQQTGRAKPVPVGQQGGSVTL